MVSSAASVSPVGQRHCPVWLALSRHRWEQPRATHGLGTMGRRVGCITCGEGGLSLTAPPVPSSGAEHGRHHAVLLRPGHGPAGGRTVRQRCSEGTRDP